MTTIFNKIIKVLTTSGYCPPSWVFGRRWCCLLSVEVVYL